MGLIKKQQNSERVISQPLSLRSNSIWNIVASVSYSLTQWGILIVIAKLGSPEMVGIFTLALAITAPIILLFRFDLQSIVASDSNNDYLFSDYYSLSILSTILFVISIIVISSFYAPNWEIVFVITMLGLARAVESISEVLYGQMQKHERLDLTAKSRITKGIISLSLFFIIMYTTKSLILATGGYFISWLFILFIYDYPKAALFESFSFKFNKKKLLTLFLFSIPLGFGQLIGSLGSNVPRYFVEYFHDPILLGFLGAIMYIMSAGYNFILAISAAILPRLSRHFFKKETKEFIKLISQFMLLTIVLTISGIIVVKLAGEEILSLIYTPEYGEYAREFFYFAMLGLLMYSTEVLNAGLISSRVFKVQPYINIVSLVIITISSFILIPNNGIMGVFFSIALGQSAQFILTGVVLATILKRNVEDTRE